MPKLLLGVHGWHLFGQSREDIEMLIGGAEASLPVNGLTSGTAGGSTSGVTDEPSSLGLPAQDAAYYSSSVPVETSDSAYKTLSVLRYQLEQFKAEGEGKSQIFARKVGRSLDLLMDRLNGALDVLSKSGQLNQEDAARLDEMRRAFEEKVATIAEGFSSSERPSIGRFQSALEGAYHALKEELKDFLDPETKSADSLMFYKPPDGGGIEQNVSGSNSTVKRLLNAFDTAFKEGLDTAKEHLSTAISAMKGGDEQAKIEEYERYVSYYQRVVENGSDSSSTTVSLSA
jgi:hypothetical protein